MEELWNKLGAWGYAVPILMLLCLNILLFTDIFEKIIIRCWVYLENIIRKRYQGEERPAVDVARFLKESDQIKN